MVVAIGIYVLSQAFTAQLLIDTEEWFQQAHSEIWATLVLFIVLILLRVGSWIHKSNTIVFNAKNTADEF